MLFKKGITTTKTDRRVKVFIRDCGRQPVALREYSLCGECKSSPLKSWKKRTLNSLIVHTQQMINLFLRQHKSLILLLLLASIRPLMVWAQSVQKHVGYVPAVEPSTTLTWKYLKRNEVPLGYHKNLPLLQPLSDGMHTWWLQVLSWEAGVGVCGCSVQWCRFTALLWPGM